ncbi:MAG: glycosyltransferase family 2 protein [Verrucomicrobiae bacterium]
MIEGSEGISWRRKISIVSGAFNEAGNIEEFFSRVVAVMDANPRYDWELLVIDNASSDSTPSLLRRLAEKESRLKVILNRRNFGHIRSGYHAMLQTDSDAVVLICSDLQDPPEMIAQFLELWEKGGQAVVAVKEASEESPVLFFIRRFYYRLVYRLADIEIIQNFTGFGLYDRAIIKYCRDCQDPYPYFRGMISEMGASVKKVSYLQPARKQGITSNNFYTLYDLAMLGITSHSKVPLRLATMLGFAMSFFSLFVAVGYLIYKLMFWNDFSAGIAPVVIGLFLFSSVQLFFIGILGEYIGAIHTQVLRRPLVVEKERINFSSPGR